MNIPGLLVDPECEIVEIDDVDGAVVVVVMVVVVTSAECFGKLYSKNTSTVHKLNVLTLNSANTVGPNIECGGPGDAIRTGAACDGAIIEETV